VTTLLGNGELDRAHERAAFHARRLARLPHAAELAPQIEGLQALARGEMDHVASAGFADDGFDDTGFDDDGRDAEVRDLPALAAMLIQAMDDLQRWIEAQPAARLRLDLAQASAQDLGELKPAPELARKLQAWRKVFQAPDAGADLQQLDPGRWQPLLRREPMLLDSFEVLDDLVGALEMMPPPFVAGVQAALLQRALALWTLLRERWPQARCEWGWLGNRPALRLLVQRIDIDTTPRAEESFEWLRAMVEQLNPSDNHGLRERLGAVLLRRGDAAAALALADRYSDDFVGMALIRARALLALQRLDEAQAAWVAACRANRHVAALLLKARAPRPPDLPGVVVGSPEQARAVVAGQHDLWRDKAVQAWLKRQIGGGAGDTPELPLS
jgi:tetratricopeptide (TPR) repeat protein